MQDLNIKLLRVPGVYEECYSGTEVSNRVIKEFLGWKCLLTHTVESHKNDRSPDRRDAIMSLKLENVPSQKEIDRNMTTYDSYAIGGEN